jgi:hypothetical protein
MTIIPLALLSLVSPSLPAHSAFPPASLAARKDARTASEVDELEAQSNRLVVLIGERAQRLDKECKRLAKEKADLPLLVRAFQRLTVRSVKFIRWLMVQLFARLHHEPDIAALRHLYATL